MLLLLLLMQCFAVQAQTLIVRFPLEIETLDWNLTPSLAGQHLLANLMEGLAKVDEKGRVAPALAAKWDVLDGGTTYLFHIRQGVQWSDGRPLVAQDFFDSWKRLLTPATVAPMAHLLYDIEGAEAYARGKVGDFEQVGIKILGERRLQVRLVHAIKDWAKWTACPPTFPIRQDQLDKYGSGWTKPGALLGVGPFVLKSYELGVRYQLTRNPKYYGQRRDQSVPLDGFSAWIVSDGSKMKELMESGQVHVWMDPEGSAKGTLLSAQASVKTWVLGLVPDRYPSSEPKVRRGIVQGIDRDVLRKTVAGGPIMPGSLRWGERVLDLPFDLKRAKLELREAGWRSSKSLKIQLLALNSEMPLKISKLLQYELKKNLEIETTIEAFDTRTYRSALNLRSYPFFIGTFEVGSLDPLRELPRILFDQEVLVLPLFQERSRVRVSQKVRGLESDGLGALRFSNVRFAR